MENIISEYQKWKKQGEQLRAQARQAMEGRFHELLTEAVQVADEYRRDFGVPLKPPGNVTSFKFKTPGGRKPGKAKKQQPAPSSPGKASPEKIAALHKQRVQIQKKMEVAKAAGKATKNLEDRLYEVEDELRLAGEAL